MVLDVVFGGLVAMTHGLLRMAVRDEGLMRRERVIFFFIVLCCLAMMPRGVLVMLRCGCVVLCARKHVGHETSGVVLFPIQERETQYVALLVSRVPSDAAPEEPVGSPRRKLGVGLGRILGRRDIWLQDRRGDSRLLLCRRARIDRRSGLVHG